MRFWPFKNYSYGLLQFAVRFSLEDLRKILAPRKHRVCREGCSHLSWGNCSVWHGKMPYLASQKTAYGNESLLRSRSSIGEHLPFFWRVFARSLLTSRDEDWATPNIWRQHGEDIILRSRLRSAREWEKNSVVNSQIQVGIFWLKADWRQSRPLFLASLVKAPTLNSQLHFSWKLPNRSQSLCFLQINMDLTLSIQWRGKCSSLRAFPFFCSAH